MSPSRAHVSSFAHSPRGRRKKGRGKEKSTIPHPFRRYGGYVPTTSKRRLFNSLNYTNFDVENKLTFKFMC